MDWLVSLMLVWGSLISAADDKAQADALRDALARQTELAMYPAGSEETIAQEWTLLPETVFQGDALLVRSAAEGTLSWQGKEYPLRSFGQGYYAMLPVPVDMKPGTYTIGNKTLVVKAKAFETQRITVTEEQEAMKYNVQRINEDQIKIDKARSHTEPTFLYKEAFMIPVEGILTTPYGYTRYVNGKSDGSHLAIDLAADQGTPVRATNDGKVVFADEVYLTGNSIYIDHGMNLFSQYAHMSKLLVQAGDEVKKGQVIGLVGSTGFSTGPHLHFTFRIGNQPVNPNLFLDSTPFQWSGVKNSG